MPSYFGDTHIDGIRVKKEEKKDVGSKSLYYLVLHTEKNVCLTNNPVAYLYKSLNEIKKATFYMVLKENATLEDRNLVNLVLSAQKQF